MCVLVSVVIGKYFVSTTNPHSNVKVTLESTYCVYTEIMSVSLDNHNLGLGLSVILELGMLGIIFPFNMFSDVLVCTTLTPLPGRCVVE